MRLEEFFDDVFVFIAAEGAGAVNEYPPGRDTFRIEVEDTRLGFAVLEDVFLSGLTHEKWVTSPSAGAGARGVDEDAVIAASVGFASQEGDIFESGSATASFELVECFASWIVGGDATV